MQQHRTASQPSLPAVPSKVDKSKPRTPRRKTGDDVARECDLTIVITPEKQNHDYIFRGGSQDVVRALWQLTHTTIRNICRVTQVLPKAGEEGEFRTTAQRVMDIIRDHMEKSERIVTVPLEAKAIPQADHNKLLEVVAHNNHTILEIAEIYVDRMADGDEMPETRRSKNLQKARTDQHYWCSRRKNNDEVEVFKSTIKQGSDYVALSGKVGHTTEITARNFPTFENALMVELEELALKKDIDFEGKKERLRALATTLNVTPEEFAEFLKKPGYKAQARAYNTSQNSAKAVNDRIANILGISREEMAEINRSIDAKLAGRLQNHTADFLDYIHNSGRVEAENTISDGYTLPAEVEELEEEEEQQFCPA